MAYGDSFLKRQLTDPPRDVPLPLAVQLLLGGVTGFFGWFFFGFGMIFFWIFAMNTDPAALWVFRGDLVPVPGTVVATEDTHFSEGEDGPSIYAHRYQFTYQGQSYAGVSYRVGAQAEADTAVTVEFPAGRPERSRIHGMRSAPVASFALFVVLFPLIGSLFIIGRWRSGRRDLYLLKHGRLAQGKLVSQEATNTSINDRQVYRLTFAFESELGQQVQIVVKTHETHHLVDDALEPLVYDPTRPTCGTTMDHLPGSPRIDETGQISLHSTRGAFLALVLPALTIIGHGTYILVRYVL